MIQPEQWERVKAVFSAALDQPAERRAAFLDEACGGDTTLREEVDSLLAAGADSRQIIEDHALDLGAMLGATGTAGVVSMAGRRFGQYRILREIGRGGMGAVFLAERADGAFQHQVAIKIIRHTLADSDLQRRFRRERQILASLNHPNIARLLDGGMTPEGEPFLVMEFVAGEPVFEYARRTALSLDGRLALFLKICAAVAYAHQKLVVHRDIKPSNLLVTADGDPKLLDFGLAKMLEDTGTGAGGSGAEGVLQTAPAMRAFTPAYASPEQFRGDEISTASDVYTLGVVLYELLSGTRPFHFEHRRVDEIVRTIDSTPPPRPSSAVTRIAAESAGKDVMPAGPTASSLPGKDAGPMASQLKGDLDTIVLKALRKEPEQRYRSVEAFADDIQRRRDGRPIAARPQTFAYRASKFIGRNRVAVTGAVLVVLSLVLGLAGSLWQAAVAREQRDRANRRFADVRKLSNSLLFELSPMIERVQGTTQARDLLLQQAVEYLDSLATEAADEALLQSELASGYEKVGDLQGNPSNPNLIALDEAIASYTKARTIRQRLLDADPGDGALRGALAQNFRVLGNIHGQANNFDAAAKDLAVALQSYESLLADRPDHAALRLAVAQTHHDVGRNLSASRRYGGSFPYFRKAIAVSDGLTQTGPDALEIARLSADSHAQLGLALSWEGEQKAAEAEMATAAAIYEPLLARHPNDVNLRNGLWSTYWLTSSVYQEQNDRLSDEYAVKALQTIRAVAEQDPANVRARQQLAKSFSRLGQTAINNKRSAEAVGHLEQSCRILREITANESKNGRLKSELALAVTRLAEAKAAQGHQPAALTHLAEAVTIYDRLRTEFPEDKRSSRNLALTHQLIGEIHEQVAGQDRPASRAAARASFQKALDILLSLQAQQALAEFDLKFVERLKVAVARNP